MATVNKRVYHPEAMTINGLAVGGVLTVAINEGFDTQLRSSPDGLQVPILDKTDQFVRGVITCQDWPDIINLLTGAIGTCIFWERKSGVAEATGYIKHTLNNPTIHQVSLAVNQGGYAVVTANYECMAASETETIADMHKMLDTQAAPTYIPTARGGWRIITTVLGATQNIYHVTGFNFSLALPLVKACNDADIAYTCVEARLDGITASGSINFQDGAIVSAKLTAQSLLLAAVDNLVITVRQSAAAANKIITIANASFLNAGSNSDVNAPFTGYTASFEVANNPTTPLTLAGTNKIITIADAA